MLKISLLYGSYREGRMGIRAVSFLKQELEAQGHQVTVVDAQECDLGLLEKRYVDYAAGKAPKKLEEIHNLFQDQTDAFVVVSGEYNGTMQPGLMNLLDHFYAEYFHKPVGIVTYSMGGLGGARVSMHLRTILNVLGMCPMPTILGIGSIQNKIDEQGISLDDAFKKSSDGFLKHLFWYGNMFKKTHSEMPID